MRCNLYHIIPLLLLAPAALAFVECDVWPGRFAPGPHITFHPLRGFAARTPDEGE
ncbi:MAG TPA: hypothetical protein VKV37_08990 [Ktedonobacteraceae bacterium]|nr:hypothetical protein [Ktedonobacteraceae bacterium]